MRTEAITEQSNAQPGPLTEAQAEQLKPSEVRYTSGGAIEEIFNSITHAIGAGLSIAGLVVLIVLTGNAPSIWKYVSFSIYGATQIMLYLSSSIMHSFAALPRIRRALEVVDQAFIYLLIAGTYTPVTLVAMRGNGGWIIFGVIWGLALIGFTFKLFVFRKKSLLMDLLYVPMGWIIIFAARPMLQVLPTGFLIWAIVGGLAYTVGVVFYAWRKLPFHHVVWHLFVIAGSISFFLGFAFYLA